MRRLLASLLPLLLLLAACDGGDPAPPVTPPPVTPPGVPPEPSVLVAHPLEDQTMFESDAPRFFWLPNVFSQRNGVPLTYSAEVTGTAVRAGINASNYLVLTPAAIGEATVRVTARDTAGATATDVLTVRITDACPAPPPEGWEDRLPVDSLTQWNLRGAVTRVWPTRTDSTSYAGDVRLTVRGCEAGQRRYELRIRRLWPDAATLRYTVVESADHTLSYTPDPTGSGTFARFAPAAEPDTVLASAFFSNVADAFCREVPAPNPREVRLVAGRGLVRVYGTAPITHATYGAGVLTCAVRLVSTGIP